MFFRPVLALSFVCLSSVAAPTPSLETRALKQLVARNAALPAAAPIKDEDFGRRSRLSQVKLSPDGAWVAMIEAGDKGASLNLLDTKTREKRTLLALQGRAELHWSADSATIFMDHGASLAAVALADGATTTLATFDGKLEQQFVAVDPSHPRHALTDAFERAAQRYTISRVGADGNSKVIHEGDKKAAEFLVDGAGEVSFMRTIDKDFGQVVWRKQDGKWTEATRCKRLSACQLVAASSDRRLLTMVVNHASDRKALVQLDLKSGSKRVLHSDPLGVSDLRSALLAPASRQPMLAVYDMPARRNYGLDGASRQAAGDIQKRFPDSNISIGASDKAAHWLLTERGARLSQERFWLYNIASRAIEPILEQERNTGKPLADEQLAQKIALHYRGSDGALLHGYLSLPPGKAAAALPMLTMVHAGPWAKVDNDYNALVQLLVNRGYAVFQPNFRASVGYGDKYMVAPKSDFGNGRVQADIIDGVRWLLANGVGDKERLGIMGDSFGGYATLLALTHTPDLFKFGMAMVPPPEFSHTIKTAAKGAAYGDEAPFSVTLQEMGVDIGDAVAMKRIADASPAANSAKVTRPLLIIAGGKDQMVDVASISDYVGKLQAAGKPVTLLLDPDEGHHPRKPMVRAAYTHLLQRMLQEHLGGPPAPAANPELAKYLAQTMQINTALK